MPRRRSTARSADDLFHRKASRGLQSRAGPPRPADHSVDLIFARRRLRSRKSLRPVQTRRRNPQDDLERPRRKHRTVRSAQGLASIALEGGRGRSRIRRKDRQAVLVSWPLSGATTPTGRFAMRCEACPRPEKRRRPLPQRRLQNNRNRTNLRPGKMIEKSTEARR